MIKKIKKLVFVFILFAVNAHGQDLSAGVTAGISTGAAKITDIKSDFVDAVEGNNLLGFEAGLYARLKFGPFYIKPKLLLNHRYGTVDILTSESTTINSSFNQGKLEIPLLFGMKILGPLEVEAGPVYNYILYGTKNFNNNQIDVVKSGLGYRIGAGVELGHVGLTVSYQGLYNKSSGSTTLSTFNSPYEFILDAAIRLGE